MAQISSDAMAVLQQAGQGAQEYVLSKGSYGKTLTSGEATRALQGFVATPTVGQQVQTGIANLGSQQYQFDPNQYLPGIQQQASAIYGPQQAQLEAIRQLQQSQVEDTRITTEKDFDKRLSQEIESINARGGFFGGGAIAREGDIRDDRTRALSQLSLQGQAANFGNLAQQASLQADKAMFIQDRLVNSESSAYARWTDARNFSLQALTTQYQVYSSERSYARSVFESDRSFDLQKEQLEMQEKQFKLQYKMDELTFKAAKATFDTDIKLKNLSYDQALANFKKTYAVNNSGVLGLDGNGNDIEQDEWTNFSGVNIPSGNSVTGSSYNFQFGF